MQVLKKTAMLRCGMARHTLAMNHMQHSVLQTLKLWHNTCRLQTVL
jgi:hypothetical protein